MAPSATEAAQGAQAAQGEPTQIMVRVVSHDAKILGTGVGGARVTIWDARTGSLPAQGVQEGGTGDTQQIMMEPRTRGGTVFDTDRAAGFLAELDLTAPTQVRIEAEGPLGTAHATQKATRTMFLVPGNHVLGEGVILEFYGFTVELLEPEADLSRAVGTNLPVLARARLDFSGETSIYQGTLKVPLETDLTGLSLQILAMDPEVGNFGMVERFFDEIGRGQSSD